MAKELQVIPYYDELYEAFKHPLCPVCRVLAKITDRYIDGLLWEMVMDPDSRDVIIESRGFCQPHAWRLVRTGSALGVTIMMDSVIRGLLRTLDQHPSDTMSAPLLHRLRHTLKMPHVEAADALITALGPQIPCPVCANEQAVEASVIDTLYTHMSGSHSLAAVYRQSDGLCLPHFQQTLAAAAPSERLDNLLSAQRAIWEALQAELAEFIRKSDHRFAREPVGAEGQAWQYALAAVSGPPVETYGQASSIFKLKQ